MKIHWTYFLSNSITFKIYRKCSWDLYISMETHKKAPRRWKKQQHRMSVCVYVFLVNLTNKQKAQPSWMTSNANSHHWRVELLHLIYHFFSLFGTITALAQWFDSLFDHSVFFFFTLFHESFVEKWQIRLIRA